jgi:arylsulfatase A-like enzyme
MRWLPWLVLLGGFVSPVYGDQPNVILIICDDLNDYIEGYQGHPQTRTPNMARLAETGVRFSQAHCNAPICAPSRASLFTGIYPHHSGCFGFTQWNTYPVLQNSRTLQEHFQANGYRTLGTGKLMHHRVVQRGWQEFGHPADYGPFAYAGGEKVAHPDVPSPFRDIGPVDGSFGPFESLQGRTTAEGAPLSWINGGWGDKSRELRVRSQDDRDQTPDEINGDWAVKRLKELSGESQNSAPFFMAVGFIRPHTPLIVPQRFFDPFPLEDLQLPDVRPGDVEDTHVRAIRGIPNGEEPTSPRTEDMGLRLYSNLVASYPNRDTALRHFIQAYLASVASVDEQIGRILEVVDHSQLKENTIIVLTSDHGWGMGEKDYLYKNSLWQESTQIPLIVRAPGVTSDNQVCEQPVSLIDLYPTLIDLCGLQGQTMKNKKGHSLDGHSFKPLLENPVSGKWTGPDAALTALYKWRMKYDPSQESYALRFKDWRYIRYENGQEELYNTLVDPLEWDNLAGHAEHADRLASYRQIMRSRLPKAGIVPPQPNWQPKDSNNPNSGGEVWKAKYFEDHPDADANQDGKLTWPELRSYREKYDPPPAKTNGHTMPRK